MEKTDETRRFTYYTQEVADILEVHKKTLLNWLRKNWVSEPQRDENNYRIWKKEDIARVMKFKMERNEKRGRKKDEENNHR